MILIGLIANILILFANPIHPIINQDINHPPKWSPVNISIYPTHALQYLIEVRSMAALNLKV